MSWDVDFANMFKERDNKTSIGAILGTVISAEPLKISIFDGKGILTDEHCYICSILASNYFRKADVVIDSDIHDCKVTYKDILTAGDKVLCLATTDGQTYFVIDKVV